MFIKIILILIVIYFIYKYFILESFNNNIYLTKLELEKTLLNDSDDYYKNFNLTDYQVRNINSIKDYHNHILNSCINISDHNKEILDKCIILANAKIRKYTCDGFDGAKAATLQWNIGLVDGKLYEAGLPHTRNNIIILPLVLITNKQLLVSTLIHEKIHIYQKTFKNDIIIYLKKNGFVKFKKKNKFDSIRANPDIDDWVYKSNNKIMRSIYNDNPKSILDCTFIPIDSDEYEHPLEYMAYNIQREILK